MNGPWWRTNSRILWWIFTRLWAPLMAIGWPILATYGALSPNSSDVAALKLRGFEAAILIGITGGGSHCDNNACVEYPARRSYIVFPRLLTRPSAFEVEDGDSPRVEEIPGAALICLVVWLACLWGTWRYWVRRIRDGPPSTMKRRPSL